MFVKWDPNNWTWPAYYGIWLEIFAGSNTWKKIPYGIAGAKFGAQAFARAPSQAREVRFGSTGAKKGLVKPVLILCGLRS